MSIRYARAKKYMREQNGLMLADKLRLKTAVEQVSHVVMDEDPEYFFGSVVTSVGSGTMIAGIMRGLRKAHLSPQVYGIIVTNEVNPKSRRRYIREFEPLYWDGNFKLIVGDYKYKETPTITPPFPCDLFYDLKAWDWLVKNIHSIPNPILFWNVGGEWDPEYGISTGLRGDGIVTKNDIERHFNKKRREDIDAKGC